MKKVGQASLVGTIFVTIDTEMDADIHWRKGNPVSFSSILVGIPQILRPIWDEFHISPIYFLSPEVVSNKECCDVIREEIKKGAVIGAHLHPEYIEPERVNMTNIKEEIFPCYGCSYQIEYEKIKNLQKLIEKNLGIKPEWYRAARFGADMDTIKILSKLDFKFDSSFTPGIDWSKKGGPNHSDIPLNSYDITNRGRSLGIREYPVSILGKRFGLIGKLLPDNWLFYQWLRPTHMTYIEERYLIRKLKKSGIKDITMMFHSMEIMVRKSPYVRNNLMQKYYIWRLRNTFKYAAKQGYRFYKVTKKIG